MPPARSSSRRVAPLATAGCAGVDLVGRRRLWMQSRYAPLSGPPAARAAAEPPGRAAERPPSAPGLTPRSPSSSSIGFASAGASIVCSSLTPSISTENEIWMLLDRDRSPPAIADGSIVRFDVELAQDVVVGAGVDVDRGVGDRARDGLELRRVEARRARARDRRGEVADVGRGSASTSASPEMWMVSVPPTSSVPSLVRFVSQRLEVDVTRRTVSVAPACSSACAHSSWKLPEASAASAAPGLGLDLVASAGRRSRCRPRRPDPCTRRRRCRR